MRSLRRRLRCVLAAAALAAGLAALAGCGGGDRGAPRTFLWLAGVPEPDFDPGAPPRPVRGALLRLLNRGLVEEDSSLTVRPAAAESVTVSPDGLVYAFRLRRGLAFTDGTPCASADFRAALVAGLTRTDHATRAWLLGAVRGVDRVRP